MAKAETFKKRKKSGTKFLKAYAPFKSQELKDPHLVADVLLDCIKTGDIAFFREVLTAHLMTVNKSLYAKKIGLGRRTLFDLLDPKKRVQSRTFNDFGRDKVASSLGLVAPYRLMVIRFKTRRFNLAKYKTDL